MHSLTLAMAGAARDLFARYEAEVSVHKKGAQPREDQRRIELWTHVLGANRTPGMITKGQISRFERLRREGRIELPKRRLTAAPTPRTVGADIEFLAGVMNWFGRVRKAIQAVESLARTRPS